MSQQTVKEHRREQAELARRMLALFDSITNRLKLLTGGEPLEPDSEPQNVEFSELSS